MAVPPEAPAPPAAGANAPALASQESETARQRLIALRPLTDDLAKAVTCPICLEYMEDARQLQCGHFFCPECVVRMLAMRKVRCAVCKEKTGKRMVRSAPLPFREIVSGLRLLEEIVRTCGVNEGNVAVNDGYDELLRTTLERIRKRDLGGLREREKEQEKIGQVSVSPASRICALCPDGVDPTTFGDDVVFGMLKREIGVRKQPLFAHENCALFTEGVYEVDGRLDNVGRALREGKDIACGRARCGKTSANIRCMQPGCTKRYHYPCAVAEKCVMVVDGYRVFCHQHREHAPKINQADFEKNLTDPAGEVSMFHEDCCYLCRSGGRLLMCDTCERVTHPACSGLTAIPLGDWSCGVCTGVHKTPIKPKSIAGSAVKAKQSGAKRRRSEIIGNGTEERSAPASATKRARRGSEGAKRYILAHTGLQEPQRELLHGVAKMRRAVLKPDLDGRVTHLVIRAYTPGETPARTMKLCKAIVSKTPLVCWKWVEDSSNGDGWAPIEGHIHPLSWKQSDPSIFDGKRFYFGCFAGQKDKREEFINLVQLGGGTIVHREPSNEMANDGQNAVIYVRDEDTRKNGRRELLSRFEPPPGATVVTSTWVLDQCTKNRESNT